MWDRVAGEQVCLQGLPDGFSGLFGMFMVPTRPETHVPQLLQCARVFVCARLASLKVHAP